MKRIEFVLSYLLEHKVEAIEEGFKSSMPVNVIKGMAIMSLLSLSVFGFVIGCSHSLAQGAVSMIKLPVLFFTTASICFPSLYLFLALLGMKINVRAMAQFTLICLTLTSVILLTFSPVSLFFWLTGTHYTLFKFINVGVLAIAGMSGVHLFYKYLMLRIPADFTPVQRRRCRAFVFFWIIMYALIGANMGFAISPVFGDPNAPFMIFTSSGENFFSHLINVF